MYMHAETRGVRRLEEGQLWKVEHGYVAIEQLGERLIQYKMLRQADTKAAITQFIRIEALQNFLSQTEAELVGRSESAQPAFT